MFKDFKEGFKSASFFVQELVNAVFLFIVYIVVIITSIIFKISGKSFFDKSLNKRTYWKKYEKSVDFHRMF